MSILPSSNRRVLIAVAIYAVFILALSLFGIIGNTDEQAVRSAQTHFSTEAIATGRAYFAWGIVPSIFSRLAKLAVLFFFMYNHRAIVSYLENKIPRKFIHPIIIAFFAVASLLLISFPFSVASGFFRKRAFGLIEGDFALWFYRYAISSIVINTIALLAILLFIFALCRYNRYRLLIPAIFLTCALAGILLYPRAILSLTHSVKALENSALKSNITQMLEKAHTPVRAMYIINESKYSKHVNAFFTGWGPYREIYLFDTLLHNHTDEETLSIIAHELCHYREEHVLIGIIMGALGLYLALIIMEKLCYLLFNQTLVMAAREMKIAHLLLMFSMLTFIAQPVKNSISRAMERRCDAYACELSGNRKIVAEMEKKIAIANRSDVLPHPLYHFWFATHPAPVKRIESAMKGN